MSVNVPMNKAQKDKDVAQKLQLYGIFEAFSDGKIPSVSHFPPFISNYADDTRSLMFYNVNFATHQMRR